MTIKIKLGDLLWDRHLKQVDIVRMTGIRPNTISTWARGKVDRIDTQTLDAICKALGCKVEDIVEYVEEDE